MLLGGAAAVLAVVYLVKKNGGLVASAGAAGTAAGEAVVTAAGGAATGAVVGIGKAVGIPETNQDACQAALAAQDGWAVSTACPAGTWIKYITGQLPAPTLDESKLPSSATATNADQQNADNYANTIGGP